MANGRNPARSRSKSASMRPEQAVTMDLSTDISAWLADLEQGVQTKVLRPMAHAGIEVFYQGLRAAVPVAEGTLFGSIYQWHDNKRSTPTRQTYATGPNKRKAPHWYNVEHGHWRVNVVRFVNGRWVATRERLAQPKWVMGKPYIRPTFDARRQEALNAMVERGRTRMAELAREIHK